MKLTLFMALFPLLFCPPSHAKKGGEGVGDGDQVRMCRSTEMQANSGPCAGEALFQMQSGGDTVWCCNKAKSLIETDGADPIFNSY